MVSGPDLSFWCFDSADGSVCRNQENLSQGLHHRALAPAETRKCALGNVVLAPPAVLQPLGRRLALRRSRRKLFRPVDGRGSTPIPSREAPAGPALSQRGVSQQYGSLLRYLVQATQPWPHEERHNRLARRHLRRNLLRARDPLLPGPSQLVAIRLEFGFPSRDYHTLPLHRL